MSKILPSGPEFEALMTDIDGLLIAGGVEIPARPLRAGGEISLRLGIPVPIAGPEDNVPTFLAPYIALGKAIIQWYDDNYGNRLKVEFGPGRTVVELDGDLYVIKIPRFWGRAEFIISREFREYSLEIGVPSICNVLQLADDLTPQRAMRLSEDALTTLGDAFMPALTASYTLERTHHELLNVARGDISTAIASLMDRPGRFGASKWASLQAAEKIIKAAIELAGVRYNHGHELRPQIEHLARLGVHLNPDPYVMAIQCQPNIRYGKQSCTRREALAAHRASLSLVNELRAAGAKFEKGIDDPVS